MWDAICPTDPNALHVSVLHNQEINTEYQI